MTHSAPIPGSDEPETISTGSSGLDDILSGGFDADRVYLIEGRPGTGKTTLALQFLLEGARQGEPCLYVTLSESESKTMRFGFISRTRSRMLLVVSLSSISAGWNNVNS